MQRIFHDLFQKLSKFSQSTFFNQTFAHITSSASFSKLTSANTTTVSNHQDPSSQTSLMIIIVIAYSIIFIFGLLGNSMVVYIVAKSAEMRNPTYIFIANLALSDIVLCLLAVPFTPLNGLFKSWVFGDVLCRTVPAVLCLCVHVSTQTSTAIAIERYFAIVYPFRPRISIKTCVNVTVFIWLVSGFISTPVILTQALVWRADQAIYECEENWNDTLLRKIYTLANLCLQYLGPCCIIAFCYIKVSLALRERAKAAARRSSFAHASRQKSEIERKRRTNKMLVFMIVFFMLAWLPLNITLIVWEISPSIEESKYFVQGFLTAHLIAMSSTVYNPMLYAWLNELFKKEMQKVFPCLFKSFVCCVSRQT